MTWVNQIGAHRYVDLLFHPNRLVELAHARDKSLWTCSARPDRREFYHGGSIVARLSVGTVDSRKQHHGAQYDRQTYQNALETPPKANSMEPAAPYRQVRLLACEFYYIIPAC
jgi:hypothetical protein